MNYELSSTYLKLHHHTTIPSLELEQRKILLSLVLMAQYHCAVRCWASSRVARALPVPGQGLGTQGDDAGGVSQCDLIHVHVSEHVGRDL